jgi:DNA-binding Lrp family transcriptional regulator
MKKRDIDAKDIEILNILKEDANVTNKDLAQKLHLSEGPTLVRVQNLFKKGVIKRYVAEPNYGYFGYTYEVATLVRIFKEFSGEFVNRVLKYPNVRRCIRIESYQDSLKPLTATEDFMIVSLNKSPEQYKQITDELGLPIRGKSFVIQWDILIVEKEFKNSGIEFTKTDIR